MAVLTASDIADLVAGTLLELGPPRFQQIAQNYQDYEVFSHWFKRDKVQFDNGRGIQRNLMNKLSDRAAHVGLLDTVNPDIPDLIDQLDIPWRTARTDWSFIYQEVLMNRGRSLVFNVVEPRRADALISLAEELERRAWEAPASTDKVKPYGLPYYLVYSATTGFDGGAPANNTTVAGVSLTDSPTYKNYTAQYTNVTKADLISKMRTAHRKCNFKSPINLADYRGERGQRYRIYVNEETMQDFEDVGESQNENLGRDLASMDGTMTFRNHPIVWVPYLDDISTADPVYGVDHSTFYPVCLEGDYLRETEPMTAPSQVNVFQVFVFLTYNYLCVDRRRNFLIAKADPADG